MSGIISRLFRQHVISKDLLESAYGKRVLAAFNQAHNEVMEELKVKAAETTEGLENQAKDAAKKGLPPIASTSTTYNTNVGASYSRTGKIVFGPRAMDCAFCINFATYVSNIVIEKNEVDDALKILTCIPKAIGQSYSNEFIGNVAELVASQNSVKGSSISCNLSRTGADIFRKGLNEALDRYKPKGVVQSVSVNPADPKGKGKKTRW